jgi:hypothetical protein
MLTGRGNISRQARYNWNLDTFQYCLSYNFAECVQREVDKLMIFELKVSSFVGNLYGRTCLRKNEHLIFIITCIRNSFETFEWCRYVLFRYTFYWNVYYCIDDRPITFCGRHDYDSVIVCLENRIRQDMEECLNIRTEMESPALGIPGTADLLGGNHQWDTTNHTRPTYCNVCKDTLHGEKFLLFVLCNAGSHELPCSSSVTR